MLLQLLHLLLNNSEQVSILNLHQGKHTKTNWKLQGSRLSWHMDYMTRPMDERLGVAIASPRWVFGEFCSRYDVMIVVEELCVYLSFQTEFLPRNMLKTVK